MCFLPVEKHNRLQCEGVFERIAQEEGLSVLGWRDTPVNGDAIGREARASQPYIEQLFVGRPKGLDEEAFERLLYRVRRRTENEIAASEIEDKETFYIPSFSCRTIIYKGLMLARRLRNSISNSPTRSSPARSAWFTSASPPTLSPVGSWRIRTAMWPTTAKSTPSAATSVG